MKADTSKNNLCVGPGEEGETRAQGSAMRMGERHDYAVIRGPVDESLAE